MYHDDDARGECFRSYNSPTDSYIDHSNFLRGSERYSSLFKLDPTDYKGWAFGLKKAGYATNNKYSQIIIKLIEDYNLQQYSLIALGKLPASTKSWPRTDNKHDSIPHRSIQESVVVLAEPKRGTERSRSKSIPQGEFLINNTRVIFAKAGSSLLAIAQQYDVSLESFTWNSMT